MNYFTVRFYYPGPYVNCPDGGLDNFLHVSKIESILDRHGLQFCHEYSWSDGSCYLNVRTPLSEGELKTHLERILIPSCYSVLQISNLESEPGQAACKRKLRRRMFLDQKYAVRKRRLPCKDRFLREFY